MKKSRVLTFALVFLFGSVAARADDITVFDKNGACGVAPGKTCEDNETEADGGFGGQIWDLEAFIQEGNILSIVGGFDFMNGVTNHFGDVTLGGDIFISTGHPLYGYDAPAFDGSNNTLWDYAIRMDFNTMEYYVYRLNNDPEIHFLNTVFVDSSHPYMVDDWTWNPVPFITGRPFTFSEVDSTFDDWADGPGGPGTHYMVSGFDLSEFLSGGQEFYAHYTMSCGNDNLIGKGTAVPEPTSLILLGLGLTGLGLGVLRKP